MTTIEIIHDAWMGLRAARSIVEDDERQKATRLGAQVIGKQLTFNQFTDDLSQSIKLSSQLILLNKKLQSPLLSKVPLYLIFIPIILASVRLVLENSPQPSLSLSQAKAPTQSLARKALQNKDVSFKHKTFSFALKTVTVLSECWGRICLVGCVVCCVALFLLRNMSSSTAFLLVIAVRYLETKIKSTYLLKLRKLYLPLLNLMICPIIMWYKEGEFSRLDNRLFLLINLYSLKDSYSLLFAPKFSSYEDKSHPHLLSWDNFLKILNLDSNLKKASKQEIRIKDVEVNREHIFTIPFPTIASPASYFAAITDYWDAEAKNWDDKNLIASIESADRFAEFAESKLSAKEFTKRLLDTFVTQIKDQSIETGSPLNYRTLHNKLGFIGLQMQSRNHCLDLKKTALLALALDGGGLCGTGVHQTLSKVASIFLSNSQEAKGLPLKQRILMSLEEFRTGILEKAYFFYQSLTEDESPIIRGDNRDVHLKSGFFNIFGPDFGVADEGAANDALGPLETYSTRWFLWSHNLFNKPLKQVKAEQFWQNTQREVAYSINIADFIKVAEKAEDMIHKETHKQIPAEKTTEHMGYTAANILDTVRDAMDSRKGNVISKEDIYRWAQDWCKETNPNSSEEFNKALTDKQILEESLVEGDVAFTDAALIAMLVDMGILKLKETSSS